MIEPAGIIFSTDGDPFGGSVGMHLHLCLRDLRVLLQKWIRITFAKVLPFLPS
jgi:hypothetical protein